MPSASVVRFRHWLALYAALGRVRWHWAQGRGMVLYNIAITNKYDKPINRQTGQPVQSVWNTNCAEAINCPKAAIAKAGKQAAGSKSTMPMGQHRTTDRAKCGRHTPLTVCLIFSNDGAQRPHTYCRRHSTVPDL